MNTRMNNAGMAGEENFNDVVPPQAPQNPQIPIEEGATSNMYIRSSIQTVTQVLTNQVANDARVQVNPMLTSPLQRLGISQGLIPLLSLVLKWRRIHKGSLIVLKVLNSMGVSSQEKAKLFTYKFKVVAQFLY